MKKKSLTGKNITANVFIMLFNLVVLLLIVFISLYIKEKSGVTDYIADNYIDMIVIAGSFIVLSVAIDVYFYFEDADVLKDPKKLMEIFLLLYVALILDLVVGVFVDFNARPVAFFAMMCAILYGRRNASYLLVVFTLFTFVVDAFSGINDGLDVCSYATDLLVVFCTGMVAIFLMDRFKTRLQCVLLTLILLIPIECITAMLSIETLSGGTDSEIAMLFVYGALDSVFSVVLFLLLLPVFEKMFANLTVFRLHELTSDNAKLIYRLKRDARGSYNHSVMVAQFAEACASDIGENPELARAVAYYHDVGKMKEAGMFTENQFDGVNPHDAFTPELSADIIRSHTRLGAEVIRKNHLPEIFADVALEHHGTMPIKYFYAKALKMSDREIKIENYSYFGPIPSTKIAAIIMICDSVEAASRAMPNKSQENVENLVREVIEERLDMGQFDNCPITMQDLTKIRETLVSQISGVYHKRIEYPKIKVSRARKS
ncbi:MAG: HDIG domain-containing protein [Clostridia bacterium]|nr:HDIG domain-containing protein [Clostridia bacterium]